MRPDDYRLLPCPPKGDVLALLGWTLLLTFILATYNPPFLLYSANLFIVPRNRESEPAGTTTAPVSVNNASFLVSHMRPVE